MARGGWFAWWVGVVVALAACSAITSFDGLTGTAPNGALDGASAAGDASMTTDAGCTADLTTSQNCGACGHDCFGGPCMQGVCGPVPILTGKPAVGLVEVHGQLVAFAAAVDAGALSNVYAMQSDGGDLRVLLTQQDGPNYATSDQDRIYFSNYVGGEIQTVRWDGSGFATLAQSKNVNQVTLTTRGLVFATQGDGGKNGGLYLVDTSGSGGASAIVTQRAGPECVAQVDGGFVFTDYNYGGTSVVRVEDDGTTRTIAAGKNPACLAADGTFAYWSDKAANTINRTDVVSGTTTQLAATTAAPGYVRIDYTYVYWLEHTPGNVRRVRKDGSGVAELVYGGNGTVDGLAVDDKAIYFTLGSAGIVMKLAK